MDNNIKIHFIPKVTQILSSSQYRVIELYILFYVFSVVSGASTRILNALPNIPENTIKM